MEEKQIKIVQNVNFHCYIMNINVGMIVQILLDFILTNKKMSVPLAMIHVSHVMDQTKTNVCLVNQE